MDKDSIRKLIYEIRSWKTMDRRYYDVEYHALGIARSCADNDVDSILESILLHQSIIEELLAHDHNQA